jgi:hypothetical protein
MKQPATSLISIKQIFIALVAFALLTGAIISTSSVAQLSYQAAQLQQQERLLNQQKQYLQEQLAQAHSLSTPQAFAVEQGFSQLAQAKGRLDVIPSLAQAH